MAQAAEQEHNDHFAILYCTADLMLGSPIHSTAEALRLTAYAVRTLDKLESHLVSHHGPCAFVVDLDVGEVANDLLRAIAARKRPSPIRTIAFGPHVNEKAFHDAVEAGADEIMPRGQFVRNLPAILQDLASGKFSQAWTYPAADDDSR